MRLTSTFATEMWHAARTDGPRYGVEGWTGRRAGHHPAVPRSVPEQVRADCKLSAAVSRYGSICPASQTPCRATSRRHPSPSARPPSGRPCSSPAGRGAGIYRDTPGVAGTNRGPLYLDSTPQYLLRWLPATRIVLARRSRRRGLVGSVCVSAPHQRRKEVLRVKAPHAPRTDHLTTTPADCQDRPHDLDAGHHAGGRGLSTVVGGPGMAALMPATPKPGV
jgi:hypothetical protein